MDIEIEKQIERQIDRQTDIKIYRYTDMPDRQIDR